MKLLLNFILFSLFSLQGFSATFNEIPLESLVKSSDASLLGKVINISSHEENYEVMTKVEIEAGAWEGLEVDQKILSIYVPGGSTAQREVRIEGTPKFNIGDTVFVFLVEYQSKYWISNLALGSFQLRNFGKDEFLVNQVFPNNFEYGQLKTKTLLSSIEKHKKVKFTYKKKTLLEIKNKQETSYARPVKKGKRAIASEDITSDKLTTNSSFNLIWILVIFFLLIFFNFLKRNKE